MLNVSTRRFVSLPRMLALGLLLATAGLAACGGDDPVAPIDVQGTYTLRTANGSNVPVTFTTPAGSVFVETGTLILQAGAASGTLSIELNDVEQAGPFSGTYTVSGNQIVLDGAFQNSDDLSFTGVITGTTITISDVSTGLTLGFRKN